MLDGVLNLQAMDLIDRLEWERAECKKNHDIDEENWEYFTETVKVLVQKISLLLRSLLLLVLRL